jgi:hypothetical protein
MLAGHIALWDPAFLIECYRLRLFQSKPLNYPQFRA